MGSYIAKFPSAIATDGDLKIAANRLTTRLRSGVSASDSSWTLTDTSRIVAGMLLSCDDEIVSVSAISGSTVTVVRGFDDTAAASHAANRPVEGRVDAYHHNALREELQAIQTALGPNLANVASTPPNFYNSELYDFAPRTPGGSLIVGNNSITLSPVPAGINGTNTNHYLYISGGTGAAEAVPITGGTAVSGAASGTVIVTCANAHSGAWTIRSATAGIQEAAWALAPLGGGTVAVPPGVQNFYGTMHYPATASLNIIGAGAATRITVHQLTGVVFSFDGAGNTYGLRDLLITPATGTPADLRGVHIGENGNCTLTGLVMYGLHVYFDVQGISNAIYITNNICQLPFANAIGVNCNAGDKDLGNLVITGNGITAGTPGGFLAGVFLGGATRISGIWITNNDIFHCNYGLYCCPENGAAVGQLFSLGNAYQSTSQFGIAVSPIGTGYVRVFMSSGDNVEAGILTGIQIGGNSGVVDSVNLSNAKVNHNGGVGIHLRAGAVNTSISNCTVAGNSRTTPGTFPGLGVDAGVSKWVVTGGVYGPSEGLPTSANTQSYGIAIAAGASDDYIITGAYIPMNMTGALIDQGAGVKKIIANNLAVDTSAPVSIVSAASVALPKTGQTVFYISGTTTVTTITGGRLGQNIRLLKPDGGTLTIGGGGNIPGTRNLAQFGAVTLTFDGAQWYG